MLEAVCPNGHRLQIPPEHAGLKLRCPACNAIFQLAGTPQNPGASGLGLQNAPATAAQVAPPPAAAANPAPAQHALQPAGAEPAPTRWAGGDAAAAPPPPPAASAPLPAQRAAGAPLRRLDLGGAARTWGQIGMMIGLVLVLSARGCDGLALRNIGRLKANVELAQNRLKDRQFEETAPLQRQLNDPALTQTAKESAMRSLEEVGKKYAKERAEFEDGEGHRMTSIARDAELENRGWAYWREMAFVAGSILLSIGLIAMILYGLNVERYLAFGMLAILLFSLYIGGAAWLGSIVGTMSGPFR